MVQILAQVSIFTLDRLGQLTLAIAALEVRVQPIGTVRRYEIAYVANSPEIWRTHCILSFHPNSMNLRAQIECCNVKGDHDHVEVSKAFLSVCGPWAFGARVCRWMNPPASIRMTLTHLRPNNRCANRWAFCVCVCCIVRLWELLAQEFLCTSSFVAITSSFYRLRRRINIISLVLCVYLQLEKKKDYHRLEFQCTKST